MLSNFVGKEPVDQRKHFDQKEKKHTEVEQPATVAIYNKCMGEGGMDKMDILHSLYRSKIHTRKWYLRIASHLFSLAAVNSWIL